MIIILLTLTTFSNLLWSLKSCEPHTRIGLLNLFLKRSAAVFKNEFIAVYML